MAAGGKLYQVVVNSEETAKALLDHGQLRNRVTIIPLNKVFTALSPTNSADLHCECGNPQSSKSARDKPVVWALAKQCTCLNC